MFVVPSWHSVRHAADKDSRLFSFSGRTTQEPLGLWLKDRENS